MPKRKDSQSLQALKAIWGDSVVTDTESDETKTPASTEKNTETVTQATSAPLIHKDASSNQKADQPLYRYDGHTDDPEPVIETVPAPRRVGRPASKTPKRSYGVSLSTNDYDALREMAKGADKSITELLEDIIREYDRNHPALREKYRKIQALLNS